MAIWMHAQQLVQMNSIKLHITSPLWGESTVTGWLPHNGLVMQEEFPDHDMILM